MRKVEAFLKAKAATIGATTRNNLRFYLGMLVAMRLANVPKPSKENIASLDAARTTQPLVDECLEEVSKAYEQLGGTDQVAKGTALKEKLKADFLAKFKAEKAATGTGRSN